MNDTKWVIYENRDLPISELARRYSIVLSSISWNFEDKDTAIEEFERMSSKKITLYSRAQWGLSDCIVPNCCHFPPVRYELYELDDNNCKLIRTEEYLINESFVEIGEPSKKDIVFPMMSIQYVLDHADEPRSESKTDCLYEIIDYIIARMKQLKEEGK